MPYNRAFQLLNGYAYASGHMHKRSWLFSLRKKKKRAQVNVQLAWKWIKVQIVQDQTPFRDILQYSILLESLDRTDIRQLAEGKHVNIIHSHVRRSPHKNEDPKVELG